MFTNYFIFIIDLIGASVGMLIAMCIGLVPRIYSTDHPNPVNIINGLCKTRTYFGQCGTMLYRWSLTMACIDRCASASFNVRLRLFASPRTAIRVTVIIAMIWFIVPVHNFIYLNIIDGQCMWFPVASAIYNSMLVVVAGGIIPITTMILSGIIIRKNLQSKRELRRTLKQSTDGNARDRIVASRDRQTLFMLFIQIICYIALTLPWIINLVYNAFTFYITNKTNDRIAIDSFIHYTTETLAYIYSTSSFYLYTLASPSFREHLKKVINSVWRYNYPCCGRFYRVAPS
ncbi:unnamed protein product [Adineta ricciae]|uniref:G-protein coupled receptors family 1 profile domain-containing protein n=1 Tax=Adineta ricciae TaxID=249248 RepID=A0A813MKY6_ADIRI|nr:unnamed protein product [Adineta ricciae]CAF0853300.1 unnamed protein product [Adineta ricciae]